MTLLEELWQQLYNDAFLRFCLGGLAVLLPVWGIVVFLEVREVCRWRRVLETQKQLKAELRGRNS